MTDRSNQMLALVKAKPEEGLWMQRQPVPEIGVLKPNAGTG